MERKNKSRDIFDTLDYSEEDFIEMTEKAGFDFEKNADKFGKFVTQERLKFENKRKEIMYEEFLNWCRNKSDFISPIDLKDRIIEGMMIPIIPTSSVIIVGYYPNSFALGKLYNEFIKEKDAMLTN